MINILRNRCVSLDSFVRTSAYISYRYGTPMQSVHICMHCVWALSHVICQLDDPASVDVDGPPWIAAVLAFLLQQSIELMIPTFLLPIT